MNEQLQRCIKGSLTYWTYTFVTIVYLINRIPTPILHLSSPFDKLFESPPNYTKLRVFGCLCHSWFHPYSQLKLDSCSTSCLFLGYSSTQSAYIVYLSHHSISNLPTLLLNRFHEATSKNYRSRLASHLELHLEGAY